MIGAGLGPSKARLETAGQVAARPGGGHLPCGTSACVGVFSVCVGKILLLGWPRCQMFAWAESVSDMTVPARRG